MRPAKTQISLGIHPVWSESSLCAKLVAKDPSFLHADSEDSDHRADAQAGLSLRWAQMPYCWFCCALAQIVSKMPRMSQWKKTAYQWQKETEQTNQDK